MSIVRLYIIFILVSILIIWKPASSQNLAGVVYDSSTNIPLAFANIGILGKPNGTVSNSNGHFYLSLKGIDDTDTLICAYLGYITQKISVTSFEKSISIAMIESATGINGVVILANPMSPKDIIELILKNRKQNYPTVDVKDQVFSRNQTEMHNQKFKLKLKKSTIDYFTDEMFSDISKNMPKNFLEYQDWLYNMYIYDGEYKKQKIKGIAHSEGNLDEIERIGDEVVEILDNMSGEGLYWKVRSGPFLSVKIDPDEGAHSQDSAVAINDSIAEVIDTLAIGKGYNMINFKINQYIWRSDFLNKPGRYKYTIDGGIFINDESVYVISFKPNGRGLEGTMYVSTTTYAILRVSFVLPDGVKGEGLKMFGVEYRNLAKEGIIYFQAYEGAYRLKYMMISETIRVGIKRPLGFVQKKERFLFDKKIEEVNFKLHSVFIIKTTNEILITETEPITKQQFESVKINKELKTETVDQYNDPSIWEGYTIIEPTQEMKEYRAKRR